MVFAKYNNHMINRLQASLISIGISICILMIVVFINVQNGSAIEEPVRICDLTKNAFCIAPRATSATDALHASTIPKIATPAWLSPQTATTRIVTYSVETRGNIVTDLEEFKNIANQTLNDSRGWSKLGLSFSAVAMGGDFTLVLSEASQMTTFSENGCDTTYSCNVGRFVIINQDRWLNPTPSWTDAGANLADYRQMVLNHETGHWLGHGHSYCSTKGVAATVMQQQSMSMQGCTPNPWPLPSELYAPTLGIRS